MSILNPSEDPILGESQPQGGWVGIQGGVVERVQEDLLCKRGAQEKEEKINSLVTGLVQVTLGFTQTCPWAGRGLLVRQKAMSSWGRRR